MDLGYVARVVGVVTQGKLTSTHQWLTQYNVRVSSSPGDAALSNAEVTVYEQNFYYI